MHCIDSQRVSTGTIALSIICSDTACEDCPLIHCEDIINRNRGVVLRSDGDGDNALTVVISSCIAQGIDEVRHRAVIVTTRNETKTREFARCDGITDGQCNPCVGDNAFARGGDLVNGDVERLACIGGCRSQ